MANKSCDINTKKDLVKISTGSFHYVKGDSHTMLLHEKYKPYEFINLDRFEKIKIEKADGNVATHYNIVGVNKFSNITSVETVLATFYSETEAQDALNAIMQGYIDGTKIINIKY